MSVNETYLQTICNCYKDHCLKPPRVDEQFKTHCTDKNYYPHDTPLTKSETNVQASYHSEGQHNWGFQDEKTNVSL